MGKRSLHFVLAAAMLAFGSGSAFPQSSGTGKKERHIGRGLGAIGGAVAGLMVGWAVSDDDAVNATAKLTRNWVIGAVAEPAATSWDGRSIGTSPSTPGATPTRSAGRRRSRSSA